MSKRREFELVSDAEKIVSDEELRFEQEILMHQSDNEEYEKMKDQQDAEEDARREMEERFSSGPEGEEEH